MVSFLDVNENFISLTEENEVYDIPTRAGETVIWRILVKGHPEPYLTWWNNDNEIIPRGVSSHYNTTFSSDETVLQIFDVSIADFGNYTLKAENKFANYSRTLFLNVTDKPSVIIESKNFHMINKKEEIKCKAAAYPKPTIEWYFKNCEDDTCHFEKVCYTANIARRKQNNLKNFFVDKAEQNRREWIADYISYCYKLFEVRNNKMSCKKHFRKC